MAISETEAVHLLGQMVDDLLAGKDDEHAWSVFWREMAPDDRRVFARLGSDQLERAAAEHGVTASHPAFVRLSVMYAVMQREIGA